VVLPEVATLFTGALTHLGRSGDDDGAFARPGIFDGSGYGPAFGPVGRLREVLGDVLIQTATALQDAGTAFVLAAEEYQKSDEVAPDTFHAMRRDAGRRRFAE
jgi:hypothetical protein